jgi:hypothetical protein
MSLHLISSRLRQEVNTTPENPCPKMVELANLHHGNGTMGSTQFHFRAKLWRLREDQIEVRERERANSFISTVLSVL